MTDEVEREHKPAARPTSSSRRFKRLPLLRKDSGASNHNHMAEKVSFDPENIVPGGSFRPARGLHRAETDQELAPFGADPDTGAVSARGSASPPSVFDLNSDNGRAVELDTEPTTVEDPLNDDEQYDLKPPAPVVSHDNMELLSSRFFSKDHLDLLLNDRNFSLRFKRFLQDYRPQHLVELERYTETKKAIAAVQYANAIALSVSCEENTQPYLAATLDDEFEAKSRQACEYLVEESLPAYITHRLVCLVTDTLVKEMTGNNVPIMKELVPSLAEVFCVTDPSLPDNPIVYASDEFYKTTQYGKEYVIGRNCRFLQGPKTSVATARRLVEALTAGNEIIETILNYKRDGTPFMNLLMIAPLYDNKGKVRYFLGCQIDVSSLVEQGRGLESFSDQLKKDRLPSGSGEAEARDARGWFGELAQALDDDELNVVRRGAKDRNSSSRGLSLDRGAHTTGRGKAARLVFGADEADEDKRLWPSMSLGHSGRLPGVYSNYLLLRPFPSLRITFTSPALRIPGLMQTKFMDRIGGPQHVREGIYSALEEGISFTAKVIWQTNTNGPNTNFSTRRVHPQENARSGKGAGIAGAGKPRWIHCTPMFGSDDRVGVWMIVMVEQEEVTGRLNKTSDASHQQYSTRQDRVERQSEEMGADKMYADYLRHEGNESRMTSSSTREKREVDDHFRDF